MQRGQVRQFLRIYRCRTVPAVSVATVRVVPFCRLRPRGAVLALFLLRDELHPRLAPRPDLAGGPAPEQPVRRPDFAALDAATSRVLARCAKRHRDREFLTLPCLIAKEVPPDLNAHLLADNYATHEHAKVKVGWRPDLAAKCT